MAYLAGMVGGVMEILTLLKANIRRKRGSFTSVVLLTLIIAMSVTTILGIKESAYKGVYEAHEMMDTPDLWIMCYAHKLTDKMVEDVRSNPNVGRIKTGSFLLGDKSVMGKEEYTNSIKMMRCEKGAKLLEDDLSAIREDVPPLKKGEIYVPQGLLSNVYGEVGQKVTIETIGGNFEFTVKGILLDPYVGASVIGWKRYYISDEDYQEIEAKITEAETKEQHRLGTYIEVYKSDDCQLTSAKFRRQLNIDTGVIDMGMGSLTKDMSIHYTTLFPQIISSILMVFIMLLLVIVLIVTVHSISMEIETNYVTFGVLKAQGFDRGKIRALFLLQYLMAEILGAVLGIALSIPLIGQTSNIFVYITAIPAVLSVPFGTIAMILAALFLMSAVSIIGVTARINKISPVRAISGAKKEIYFDSRMNAPVSKKLLLPSLAFRQFTSAKRRYVGTFAIVGILVFFMMTISVLSNTVDSKSAAESMGIPVTEVDAAPKKKLTDKEFAEIEKEIERFTKINKKYYYTSDYFSFNGEQIMCQPYKNPDAIPVIKGRAPVYDNEIAVSPILMDEFDLKIGDEVTVGWEGKKEKYLISGTVQLMNDAGKCFLISYDGAGKIGFDKWLWGMYSLEDSGASEKIVDSLNKKFGELIEARGNSGMLEDSYQIAIEFMQAIIYVFSLLFSMIIVHMVCTRSFVQERTDIGIYKAVGFTSKKLRLQFAVRYFIVAVVGSAVGAVFSYAFSARILGLLLSGIGLTNFKTIFYMSTFLMPMAVICVGFFVFAYLASGKIKKVEIKELVMD